MPPRSNPAEPTPSRRRSPLRPVLAIVLIVAAALVGWAALSIRAQRRPRLAASSHTEDWKRAAAVVASTLPAEPPPPEPETDIEPDTLEAQREALFKTMKERMGLTDESVERVRAIFLSTKVMSQGNPKTTRHPMTRSECRKIRKGAGLKETNNPICGARNMAALFDPGAGQTEKDARVCIDQFEFPGLPCEYPVVFVRANQAADLCLAVGKRICDAHEWEGACAGALKPPEQEYVWGPERIETSYAHNKPREIVWAYGPKKDHSKCATGSFKNRKCDGSFTNCGSNTYPAGSFPVCVSSFGVYDQHGNAAEHMNLPLKPEEMASTGHYGSTEMKGSWFIFQSYEAHEDDCRWRAWDWHGTRLMDPESHRNYHLGFRCCKDVPAR